MGEYFDNEEDEDVCSRVFSVFVLVFLFVIDLNDDSFEFVVNEAADKDDGDIGKE